MRRLLISLALLSFAHLGFYHATRAPRRPPGAPALTLSVPPGASAAAIAQALRELGIGGHPLLFRVLVYQRGAAGRLRAGEYSLEGPVSLADIVDRLVRGEVVRRDVTFPEGKSLGEMAAIAQAAGLGAEAFLRAARDPAPIRDLDPKAADLEGYLFPDTYDVGRTPDAASLLVSRMLARFREVMAPRLPRLAERGLTLRELVTLASLVELETARPEERARVAAVFQNRLERGMLLQTDPTVIYALRQSGAWDGNIRKKDLALDSPYNTYRRGGLPPGPIASPGRAALEAALDPAPVKDLYFVSRNDGSHEFSQTLAEHERAVTRYQRRRAARPRG